ncbi:RHS repeat-associated core domain-containing protein [Cellulomonas soli]
MAAEGRAQRLEFLYQLQNSRRLAASLIDSGCTGVRAATSDEVAQADRLWGSGVEFPADAAVFSRWGGDDLDGIVAWVHRVFGEHGGEVALRTTVEDGMGLRRDGDVTGTLPIGDGEAVASWTGLQFTSFDEFGNPEPLTSAATGNAPPAARYGWLGAAQRSADTPTGTILMGVRLYSPVTGRFLQTDPVPGGSASAYDYCNADPVNCTDLGGTFSWKGLAKVVAVVAETASMFVPGPVGAAVGALAAGAYLAAGDKDAAKMAAIGAAATLVGAGLAVAAVKAARVVKTAQTLGRLATRGAQKVARAATEVQLQYRAARSYRLVGELRYGAKALKRGGEKRSYQTSPSFARMIVKFGKKSIDDREREFTRFVADGSLGRTPGTFKIVMNHRTGEIRHYGFHRAG